MTKNKALQMAINALINCNGFEKAIQACKEALEQPKEPQYLYVSQGNDGKPELSFIDHQESIGKIKLKADHAD